MLPRNVLSTLLEVPSLGICLVKSTILIRKYGLMQPRKLGFYSQESGNIVSSTVGKGPGEFASSIPFGNPSKTKNSHKESLEDAKKGMLLVANNC